MLAGQKNATSATRPVAKRDAALTALYNDISEKHMFPFWATSADVAHDEIRQLMGTQKAVPHLWTYRNGDAAAPPFPERDPLRPHRRG